MLVGGRTGDPLGACPDPGRQLDGGAYTLRAGHHDLEGYYTALSAQAQPGIRETYLAGNWQAAPWLALQGDLWHSENEAAKVAGGVAAVRSNAASFSDSIGFGTDWPGLSLTLMQSVSDGENPNGSDNRQWGYSANLGYATQTTQVGLSVAASRTGLGTLGAGVNLGWVDPNPAGNEVKNLAYTLEATHPFKGDRGSVKLYARDTRYHSGNAALKNPARTLGIQFALVF